MFVALNQSFARLATARADGDCDSAVAGAGWHLKAYEDGEIVSGATSDIARAIGSICHLQGMVEVSHLTHVFYVRNICGERVNPTLNRRDATLRLRASRSAGATGEWDDVGGERMI